jgi:hypothetical protein
MASELQPQSSDLYEADFYAWALEQARLLRARQYDALDLGNLIEEVDDLGAALKRSARSRIRTIIDHLLKLQHSPAQEPRGGWYDAVIAQRSDLRDELTASLRREIEPDLPKIYDQARAAAATSLRKHEETGAADALPADCPFTLDQLIDDWWPQ